MPSIDDHYGGVQVSGVFDPLTYVQGARASPSGSIPQDEFAIVSARGDESTVRRERDSVHFIGSFHLRYWILEIPNFNSVGTGGEKFFPIGEENEVGSAGVTAERADLPTGLHIPNSNVILTAASKLPPIRRESNFLNEPAVSLEFRHAASTNVENANRP